MSYNGYIVELKELRKHSNADRLQVATVFTNDVIVSLDYKVGDKCIYFPTDGQLSIEYATINDLVRRKDEAGNNVGGYLDPEKRNVTTIKLRGEKSDGLLMPIKSLESFTDITKLKVGDQIDVLNGKLICEKYIPKSKSRNVGQGNRTKTKKKQFNAYPLFTEHRDTEQLVYNLNRFKKGDLITISLKMHGTSQRTTRTLRKEDYKGIKGFFKKLFNKGNQYDVVTGTRRVVLESFTKETSFYGTDLFRKKYHDLFKDKLHKGETVYYEVVGYTDTNALIMGEVDNKKTKDPEFIKQYGLTTKYEYGCKPFTVESLGQIFKNEILQAFKVPERYLGFNQQEVSPQNKIFVYRMTMTNEDGYVVEYPTSLIKLRCEEMGVEMVPIFEQFKFTTKATLLKKVKQYEDGPDPIGKTHIREGVVVRIENRPVFTALKNKNFSFKVLEGISKVEAEAPDMEESQGVE